MPREVEYTLQEEEEEAKAKTTMKKDGRIVEVNQGGGTITKSQTEGMSHRTDILLAPVGLQDLQLTIRGSTPLDQGTKNPEVEEKNPETEGTGEIETDIILDKRSSIQMRVPGEIPEEAAQGGTMGQKGQSPMAIGRLPEVTARRFHAWGNL